jgi:drug/metabolite transporter (DMT)-like permease
MAPILIPFKSYTGEIASFAAAIAWALSTILFKKSGERVHPIALNLGKCSVGALCLGFIMVIFTPGFDSDTTLRHFQSGAIGLLILSGILGIGIADTLSFWSLNILGASFHAIIECTFAPFIIILSFLFLNESLSLAQTVGAAIIAFSILIPTEFKSSRQLTRRRLWGGIGLGILAMATMALGTVLMKPVLNDIPLMQVAFIRLLAGISLLWLNLVFLNHRRSIIRSLFHQQGFRYALAGSFLGGFVALLVWMAGYKFANASIAAALNQTSNVFTFLLAGIVLKESINRKKIISIVLAMSGAFLVTFG